MTQADADGALRWHQALAYAVTGRRWPELGEQPQPDLERLVEELHAVGAVGDLVSPAAATEVSAAGAPDETVPPAVHPVPRDLMTGLGYAQFAAAMSRLQHRLGLDQPPVAVRGGLTPPLTPGECRLLDEVPPHHVV